jgi:hypothetical protein
MERESKSSDTPVEQSVELNVVAETKDNVSDEPNPQDYFHAMNISWHQLGRTNAWELACTIAAEVYARSQETTNPVSTLLVQGYTSLRTKNSTLNISALANRVLDLAEDHRGESYIHSTIKGTHFTTLKDNDKYVFGLDLSKNDVYVKLETANMRELVCAFRFYVYEACKRLFHPKMPEDKWNLSEAGYRPYKGAQPRSSGNFVAFADSLLYVNTQLYKLTTTLEEIDNHMRTIRAKSERSRETRRLESYKKMSKPKLATRPFIAETKAEAKTEEKDETSEQKKSVVHIVPRAPKDAWVKGNPVTGDRILEPAQAKSEPRHNTSQRKQTSKSLKKKKQSSKCTSDQHAKSTEEPFTTDKSTEESSTTDKSTEESSTTDKSTEESSTTDGFTVIGPHKHAHRSNKSYKPKSNTSHHSTFVRRERQALR